MRLQKFLARAGVASRRKSEALIAAGRVTVDGRTVTEAGTTVDPEASRVRVDGREVRLAPTRWLALHKLPGHLCSRSDPRGRPTIYDLLPADAETLFHVGRLDYMSEGLVLLTNDGDAAHALLHPSRAIPRSYEVMLLDPLPDDLVARLLGGVELEDGLAAAAGARLEPGAMTGQTLLVLELREGRNREIRRMMEVFGVRIAWLKRVAFGPIELGTLGPGESRELTGREIAALAGGRSSGSDETEGREVHRTSI